MMVFNFEINFAQIKFSGTYIANRHRRAGRNPKQIRNTNFQMFKTGKEDRKDAATCFGHLGFGHWVLFRVSYLDIRVLGSK